MFNTYLYNPLFQALVLLSQNLGSLGLAIVVLTLTIRLVLLPLTLPSLKAADKMRELQPEINKLKKQHKDNKVALQQAQVELFRQHKINPAAGCLPQLLQLVIFIALYQVFINFLQNGEQLPLATQFLWFDVTKPDKLYILPFLAAGTQLLLGLMMLPATDTSAEKALALQTPDKKDDKEAQDMSSMAAAMQQQMLFLMPVMTFIIALRFPSGLALYWVASTAFSAVMQYYISGWGGLTTRLAALKKRITP